MLFVNLRIELNKRATYLSVFGMFFSFIMIMMFTFVGFIGDLYNLTIAFSLLALIVSISIFILLYIRPSLKLVMNKEI